MIALLDTSEDLDVAASELEMEVGQLITPLTGFRNRGRRFAIDNGAFAGFEASQFQSILRRELPNRDKCIFVAVPDVVGSARRTLEVWSHWYPKLCGWPLALVAQDGLEDLTINWPLLAAVFIGGSTEWKMSAHAEAVIRAAQAMGKWVHVGRVNGPDRIDHFREIGVDSIDGTGISRYTHMRKKAAHPHPRLPFTRESEQVA